MSSPNDQNDLEFEEQLRRMLQAEADTVSPSAEGLNLIRERTERHRRSSWFGLPWLRPVAAVAAAVLIVASVIISSPQVRDQVLEMVPAGADREGTPPVAGEERDGDVVATSDESERARLLADAQRIAHAESGLLVWGFSDWNVAITPEVGGLRAATPNSLEWARFDGAVLG